MQPKELDLSNPYNYNNLYKKIILNLANHNYS
jgi:hypothetical protein